MTRFFTVSPKRSASLTGFAVSFAVLLSPFSPFGCASGSSVSGNSVPSPVASASVAADVPTYTYEVVKSYPHDPQAFTEGLVYDNGHILESTGLEGKSTLRETDLVSGAIVKKISIPNQYFGEGLAKFHNKLYQLTYQANKGFVYDRTTFAKQGEFSYSGEGWGLTDNDTSLVMSNGTNRIRFLEPNTFAVQRSIDVTFGNNNPLQQINELEYIDGEIYANVWQTDTIARINPQTGEVLSWIDLSGLLPASERTAQTDVLNGIAWDAAGKRLFVTGKFWPKIYEIKLKLRS